MNNRATHPQLSAEELQQLRWLLGGALTLLAVSTVFYMDVGASVVAMFTTVAVAAATVRPGWLARVPRWVHRLAFSLVAAFFTADLWLTGELLPAIVRLDALLLFYRAITYRKKRDDLQLVVLGLFLVVLGGVLNVSLVFVLQILAFTVVALLLLVTITLAENAPLPKAIAAGVARPDYPRSDSVVEAAAREGEPPLWARHVQWGRLLRRVRQVTDWRVVALSTALFAGLVGLAALLFLTIPRFQLESGFFLERFVTKKTRTGFSDTIRFGDVTEITQDNGVALTVDVSDRREVPAAPYWRMLVLDEYRDATFRLSAGMRRATLPYERLGVSVQGIAPVTGDEPVYWTFYLESGVSRYLPFLGRFAALRFREPQNFRFGPNLGVLELRAEPATMLAYRVAGMESSAVAADPAFAAAWRELGPQRGSPGALLLQLGVTPADRARLAELVTEIAGNAAPLARAGATHDDERSDGDAIIVNPVTSTNAAVVDVPAFLQRAEAWLERRHRYTLSPRIPAGAGDPLLRWMVSNEAGHCELFAGSLVLLARAAGLPARVVTGFRGGSWNGYSNNFTLRHSDAHAWCEVFDASRGAWLRSDPTPGSAAAARDQQRGEQSLTSRIDRSWTARLDSLRVFWYRRIVNFDQQTQVETLQAVKEATERSGRELREALERWAGAVRDWLARPWTGGRVLVVAGAGLAIVALIWSITSGAALGLLRWRLPRGAHGVDAVRREAGRWLARLAASDGSGVEREGLVAALQRLRFGPRHTWSEPRAVFGRAKSVWRNRARAAAQRTVPE